MRSRIILTIVTLLALFAVAVTPSIASAGAPVGNSQCSGLTVDIGNPTSETQPGVSIDGWGPIQPLTSGGVWGGIAPGDCRVVWEPEGDNTATVTFSFASCVFPTCLEWRSLDGSANDSYEVYVDGTLIYTYIDQDPINDPETWSNTCVDLSKITLQNDVIHTVKFVTTGEAWESQQTYGQLAIDWITFGTAPCTGNGKVGVGVTVGNPDCICIDVSPASIDFGLLYPGQSKTIVNALTVKNCGNVNVKVTASSGAWYTQHLDLDGTNLASWSDAISTSASDMLDATLTVPAGTGVQTITDQIVFWAVKN